MTAKEASMMYLVLQEMIAYNYRSILDTWQKDRGVNIPELIGELKVKEKKANFRILTSMPIYLATALLAITALRGLLVIFLFNRNYPFVFFVLALVTVFSSGYLISMSREKWCSKAIQDRNKADSLVYVLLFDLGRDLNYFKESDFANGYSIDHNTFGGAILYTALSIVDLQNNLLALTVRGSILANLSLVAKGSSELIKLHTRLDEQIGSAKRFGRTFDRSDILADASKV